MLGQVRANSPNRSRVRGLGDKLGHGARHTYLIFHFNCGVAVSLSPTPTLCGPTPKLQRMAGQFLRLWGKVNCAVRLGEVPYDCETLLATLST